MEGLAAALEAGNVELTSQTSEGLDAAARRCMDAKVTLAPEALARARALNARCHDAVKAARAKLLSGMEALGGFEHTRARYETDG